MFHRQLESHLNKPMEESDRIKEPLSQPKASNQIYNLTERDLFNLISRIVNDLKNSDVHIASPVITGTEMTTKSINITMSTTASELTNEESNAMLVFVLVFFLWYGGLIFICLIGLGVYKKPKSNKMYESFVERREMKEKLKQQKEEERKQRRMMRQNSDVSMFSTRSLDLPNGNGKLPHSGYVSPRSLPSSLAFNSLVRHQEENEYDLESDPPSSPTDLTNQALLHPHYEHKNCIFET